MDYKGIELPDEDQLYTDFDNLRQYWHPRDELIKEIRTYLANANPVEAPKAAKFKVVIYHTGMLAGVIAEKASRYKSIPDLQVTLNNPLDELERERSSNQERWLRAAQFEMERMGDGGAWDRVMLDVLSMDMGVERIERIQAALWPDLIEYTLYPDKQPKLFDRTAYKKERGVPVRSTYVPLEYCYPRFDGPTACEVFELETRSVYSVLKDPMFSDRMSEFKDEYEGKDKSQDCIILHYDTPKCHAYYLMVGTAQPIATQQRNNRDWVTTATGRLHLLDAYEHNLGRVQYNLVAGRFGGWKTANGGIIDTIKIILHQNSIADQVGSQMATNIRATSWPTFKFMIDPNQRGLPTTGTPPAPVVQEGTDVPLFVGEDLLPLVEPKENEVIPFFFDFIRQNLSGLAGSTVLTGSNQPGVRTGYHEAQQISQAEGIDEKIEEHAAFGAIQRGTLILLHARAMGEEVWAHYTEREPKTGRRLGNYIPLNPAELYPLPRLAARVRKPRPVDAVAMLRAAREATDDRGGKGPLLSDDTALETYLAVEEPDIESKKKLIESQKRALVESGVLPNKIAEQLNLKLAVSNIPDLNEGTVQQADPALNAAIQQMAPQTTNAGGVNPHTLMQVATQNAGGAPLQTGMPPGQAQPEANVGTEVNGNLGAVV